MKSVNCLVTYSVDHRPCFFRDQKLTFGSPSKPELSKEDLLDSIIEWFLFIYPKLDELTIAVVPEHFFRLSVPLSLHEFGELMKCLKELFQTLNNSQCLILSSFPLQYERTVHWLSLVILGGENITFLCMLKKTSALSDPKFYDDDGLIPNFAVRNSRIPNLPGIPLPPFNYFRWMGKKIRLVVCKDVELERSHGLREVDIVIFIADTCGVFSTYFNAKQCFIADPFYLEGSVCSYDRINDWMLVFQEERSHRLSQSKPAYNTIDIILKNPLLLLTPIVTWVHFVDSFSEASDFGSNTSLIKKINSQYPDSLYQDDLLFRLMTMCLSIFHAPIRSYDDLVFVFRIIEMIENRGFMHYDDKIVKYKECQFANMMLYALIIVMLGVMGSVNLDALYNDKNHNNYNPCLSASSMNLSCVN
ncbi:MAG: hypothetical protein CL816_06320 [Coxiellaceae bacterium]|nr:hypothetical protein [Coxiellaceae bacterium]|tara:strand:- start:2832 stop:4082 length:1251 start_codon:yes stop_codon:yes gene_type:complete